MYMYVYTYIVLLFNADTCESSLIHYHHPHRHPHHQFMVIIISDYFVHVVTLQYSHFTNQFQCYRAGIGNRLQVWPLFPSRDDF